MASEGQQVQNQNVRFYPGLDLILLKVVYKENPFSRNGCSKWENVAKSVNETLTGKQVNKRQCRDRVNKLLAAYKADELAALKASGTDEEYKERDQLLTELQALIDETKEAEIQDQQKKKDEKKNAERENQGKVIRDAAMKSLKKAEDDDEDDEVLSPKTKRQKRDDLLVYLRVKNENEMKLRQAELSLQKEKMEIEGKERERMMMMMNNVMMILAKNQNQKSEVNDQNQKSEVKSEVNDQNQKSEVNDQK